MRRLTVLAFLSILAVPAFAQNPWPSVAVPQGFGGLISAESRDIATDEYNCTIIAQWKHPTSPTMPELELRIYDGTSWSTEPLPPVILPAPQFQDSWTAFNVGRVDLELTSDGRVGIAFIYTFTEWLEHPESSQRSLHITEAYIGYAEETVGGGWQIIDQAVNIRSEIQASNGSLGPNEKIFLSDIDLDEPFQGLEWRTNGRGAVSLAFNDDDEPIIAYYYSFDSEHDNSVEMPSSYNDQISTKEMVIVQHAFPSLGAGVTGCPPGTCDVTTGQPFAGPILGRVYDIDAIHMSASNKTVYAFTYIFGGISLVQLDAIGQPTYTPNIHTSLGPGAPGRYVRLATDSNGQHLSVAFNRSNLLGDPEVYWFGLTDLQYMRGDGVDFSSSAIETLYHATAGSAPTVGDMYINLNDNQPRVIATQDFYHYHPYGKRLYHYKRNSNGTWVSSQPTANTVGGGFRPRMAPDPCFQASIVFAEGRIWAGFAFLLGGGCDPFCS